MDISFLLFLQNIRESSGNLFTPFLEQISFFAVTYLILLPVFVYWAVGKEHGLYVLVSYYVCCGINAVVKLTACIYRPWIRDARVVPAGDAITTATGYSFPSGHAATAGPIFGGLSVVSRGWKKGLSVLFFVLAALICFSGTYMGVHTPQDVLVGIAESIFWLMVTARIFDYLSEHPEKEDLFLLTGFILGWILIIFITFKPYPMTFIDDRLLVHPERMMNDGYGDICCLIAYPVARFIEKKWICFEAVGRTRRGIALSLIGLVPAVLMIRYMKAPLDVVLGSHWGHFMYTFILVMYCIAIFPAVLKVAVGNMDDLTTDVDSVPGTM